MDVELNIVVMMGAACFRRTPWLPAVSFDLDVAILMGTSSLGRIPQLSSLSSKLKDDGASNTLAVIFLRFTSFRQKNPCFPPLLRMDP